MKKLTIVVNTYCEVSIHEMTLLDRGLYAGVTKLLTYRNPDFINAERMGFSTYNIPKVLVSYRQMKDKLLIFRGELDKVVRYLFEMFKIEVSIVDNTAIGDIIAPIDSHVTLRPEQSEFINSMLLHDNGVGIAYTSFGKTLTTLELIRKIGRRALILVHTTFLQKQWIEEMTNPLTFNFDKKRIGGAGGEFSGKKFKLGDINVALYHSAKKEDAIRQYNKNGIGIVIVDEGQKASIGDIQFILNNVQAKRKYAVTADVRRRDKKEFLSLASIGPIRYTAKEEVSASKLMSKVKPLYTSYKHPTYTGGDTNELKTDMALDRERNILICKEVIMQRKVHDRVCMIFVERVIQAGILAHYLSKFRVGLLLGSVNTNVVTKDQNRLSKVPKGVLDNLAKYDYKSSYDTIRELGDKRELDFIIGTQKMDVGISIRPVDYGLVTYPISNMERLNQIKGRLERTHNKEQELLFGVKRTPILALMVDNMIISARALEVAKARFKDDFIIEDNSMSLRSNINKNHDTSSMVRKRR